MQTLTVGLGSRSYPIFIGYHLLADPAQITPYFASRQVFIVTDDIVAPLYLPKLTAALQEVELVSCVLPHGEQNKNLVAVETILTRLLESKFNRQATLIALGGGVIGDIAGFAASCYQRGIRFIQIPTTLLAQVDSSVGGKTGVNHPLGKNMIGAFYQPQAVVIDIETLQTLPSREFSAGMAEVIKYGLLGDADFLQWLQKNMMQIMARDPQLITHMIYRSCEQKAKVVAADELEKTGLRALLNLGHTFGHALESGLGYGVLLHGEAVAIGTCMAAYCSCQLGLISSAEEEMIQQLFQQAHLPICWHGDISAEALITRMRLDKKVENGQLRLVLLEKLGKAIVKENIPESLLLAAIRNAKNIN